MLFGGDGNDTLSGLGGDDLFRWEPGNDGYDGGDRGDIIDYGFAPTGSR